MPICGEWIFAEGIDELSSKLAELMLYGHDFSGLRNVGTTAPLETREAEAPFIGKKELEMGKEAV